MTDENLTIEAALAGNFKILEWIISLEIQFHLECARLVAGRTGNIAVLQWLFDHGCPCDDSIIQIAQARGRQKTVEFLMTKKDTH
jgi:hypothetical protein